MKHRRRRPPRLEPPLGPLLQIHHPVGFGLRGRILLQLGDELALLMLVKMRQPGLEQGVELRPVVVERRRRCLHIADTGNDRIRRVSPSGTITTVAGSARGFGGDGAFERQVDARVLGCGGRDAPGGYPPSARDLAAGRACRAR